MLDAGEAFSTWLEVHAFELGHTTGFLYRKGACYVDSLKLPFCLSDANRALCLGEQPYYLAGFAQGVSDAGRTFGFYAVRLCLALLKFWRRE